MSWIVDVEGKGATPVEQVQVGDSIKGYSVAKNANVFRRVVSICHGRHRGAASVVKGHNISPVQGVWNGQTWVAAHKMHGAVFDGGTLTDVLLHVDRDEDEESNIWLLGDEPLLIRT